MKHHFRVDTSKKVYASVNFDDYMQESMINYYVDSLVAYAKPKIEEVYRRADDELQDVITEYVRNARIFNYCLSPDETNVPSEEPTNIVDYLVYHADEDGPWTWIGIFFATGFGDSNYEEIYQRLDEETEFNADVGQYYLGDNYPNDRPVICAPEIRDFVLSLILHVFALNDYNNFSEDAGLTMLEHLIDGYCDFVYRYCSARTQAGLQKYLE